MSEVERPRIGRPPLAPAKRRKPHKIGLSDAEWEAVKRAASGAGCRVSTYLRRCVLGTRYSGPKKEALRLSALLGAPLRAARIDPWPGDLFVSDPERAHGPSQWLHVEDVRYQPRLVITVRKLDRGDGTVLLVEGDAWEAYILPYRTAWQAPVRPPPR